MEEEDLRRRVVYGILSLVLGVIAARLAEYLTNRLVGEPYKKRLFD